MRNEQTPGTVELLKIIPDNARQNIDMQNTRAHEILPLSSKKFSNLKTILN